MEFEDMKKIWDTQNQRPLYLIDEPTLHQHIGKKINATRRSTDYMEIGLILINLIVVGVMLIRSIRSDHAWMQYFTAATAFGVGVYVWIGRRARQRQANRFDRSLLGELDQAIENRSYLIRRGTTFVWWYLAPFVLTTAVSMYHRFDSKTIWAWLLIGAMFLVGGLLPTWEVRKVHVPKKRALETLRKTLMQDAAQS